MFRIIYPLSVIISTYIFLGLEDELVLTVGKVVGILIYALLLSIPIFWENSNNSTLWVGYIVWVIIQYFILKHYITPMFL